MIDSKLLMKNLDWLEYQFQSYSSDKNEKFSRGVVFFSRYSVLEVCGWLEMTTDDILLKIYKTKIGEEMSEAKAKLYIHDVFGLSNNSFEKIFSNVVGFVSLRKLEISSMKADYDFLKSFVSQIFIKRNEFAHTYSDCENVPIYKTPGNLKVDVKRAEKILLKMEKKFSK